MYDHSWDFTIFFVAIIKQIQWSFQIQLLFWYYEKSCPEKSKQGAVELLGKEKAENLFQEPASINLS